MMSVLHHPCGRREVLGPEDERKPCAACRRLFDTVEKVFPIARTSKRPGDLVLGNATRPVVRVGEGL